MRIKTASRWNLSLKTLVSVWMLAAMVTAILLLGAFIVSPTAAADDSDLQRGIDAGAARYQALGEYYRAQSETARDGIQRGIDASAARYEAMREYYQAQSATASDSIQRGIDAAAARYEAMREYYLAGRACSVENDQMVTGPAFVFHRRAAGC
jgi:hypothetical protein